ncbi:MAG: hypothetical protein UT55_C0092G0006 [Candidatus Peregrinibacteria bacterium GW2011_GWE2_39_6]|nr:MAG: hypothetical protein UT36_C0001G0006 [Candidatus Peregrinibacteria bacterium GW2011_GWF2_39_17]KKR23439.1 MAG: hypothetical protein UT55_C0092G0006 [Candidatus Peregrinibacteria bacterium GW2011_GWE2_39_6]HCW32347.1 hypothetical protein [Candidatus Peregrinibacteria bacterium]
MRNNFEGNEPTEKRDFNQVAAIYKALMVSVVSSLVAGVGGCTPREEIALENLEAITNYLKREVAVRCNGDLQLGEKESRPMGLDMRNRGNIWAATVMGNTFSGSSSECLQEVFAEMPADTTQSATLIPGVLAVTHLFQGGEGWRPVNLMSECYFKIGHNLIVQCLYEVDDEITALTPLSAGEAYNSSAARFRAGN